MDWFLNRADLGPCGHRAPRLARLVVPGLGRRFRCRLRLGVFGVNRGREIGRRSRGRRFERCRGGCFRFRCERGGGLAGRLSSELSGNGTNCGADFLKSLAVRSEFVSAGAAVRPVASDERVTGRAEIQLHELLIDWQDFFLKTRAKLRRGLPVWGKRGRF